MKTVLHKNVLGELKSLVLTLIVIFCLGCAGYAVYVSKANQKLEFDLREERLRGELLLSEKLSLEKELEDARRMVEDLSKRINVVDQQSNTSQINEVKNDRNNK